jgi:capsular polysaccharide transport system permease protein
MKPLRADEIEVQTVKLVRLVADGLNVSGDAEAHARVRKAFYKRLPFLLVVVLPTLLSAVYFFALASSRYQSEAKFVVRTPGSAATSEIAAVVQGSSITRSSDDPYIAKDYILSRDAMQQLIDHDGLMDVFSKAGIDILWRYPGFFHHGDSESVEKQYLRFVNVEYDASSGISTLTTQGFNAADAQHLASALLNHTEVFLNGLNARAQSDAVKSALADVDFAKQRAYAALDAVTNFRNRQATVDPTLSSKGIVEGISSLSIETATINARLSELMTTTPQSPEIPTLRSRIAALQTQITRQRQLLGGDSSSLAPQISEYQRLLLEQTFAEKAFTSALTSLEAARLDATRQRVFLERVTEPSLPDFAAYPYRFLSVLGTLVIAFACWRVLSVLVFDTQEHHKR